MARLIETLHFLISHLKSKFPSNQEFDSNVLMYDEVCRWENEGGLPLTGILKELHVGNMRNEVLSYLLPSPVAGAFCEGEVIEVCDRNLRLQRKAKIVRISKRVVLLADGRRFRTRDGWSLYATKAYPFPSIRHSSNAVQQESPMESTTS